MSKTAVQLISDWITKNTFNTEDQAGNKFECVDVSELSAEIIKALEVEKQQIIDTHRQGATTMYGHSRLNKIPTHKWQMQIDKEAEQYYNNTYKK